MKGLPRGTLLLAKPEHPIRSYAKSDGAALVVQDHTESDFQVICWINPDPRTGMRGDITAVEHTLSWFDIVPDSERHRHVPEGFVLPATPEAVMEADFGSDDDDDD